MMIIQVAKILLKLNIWDQHGNVHQDYFIRQQQIHASYVIHHVKLVFKKLLIAFQVVKHLQIEYQKDYNEYVHLVIMNINNMRINCLDTEDILLSTCYKLCTNNEQLWHHSYSKLDDLKYTLFFEWSELCIKYNTQLYICILNGILKQQTDDFI
ncbi:unnamed protein product [Paramecium pentaurelia]|uniref:Uncharacterized protein n=1 Tax=Paramecium pentaurelia TaxID=43138 RepID=A0A8S1X1U8_9CILI|nr:unnamed protein product [Paramecium pentaurelia]